MKNTSFRPFLSAFVLSLASSACGGAVSLGEVGQRNEEAKAPAPAPTLQDPGGGTPELPGGPVDPSAGACGETGDATPRDVALATAITEGAFELDTDNTSQPNPLCDVHTRLQLKTGPACAKLEEALNGVCEILVDGQPRSFLLRFTGESCGSRIYEGRVLRASGERTVRITDHRFRVCDDMVPAPIVVEETTTTTAGASTTTRYSR